MNDFKFWVSTNKVPAAGGAAFLILFLLLGWLCFSSWSVLSEKLDTYSKTRTELESLYKQKPFPDQANLLKLQDAVTKESSSLETLRKQLSKYQVRAVGDLSRLVKDKPQDSPQYFQDKLRERVNALKNAAAASNTKVYPGFYLGMERYENGLPLPDETLALGRQLTVLNWIAEKIVSQKGTELNEFVRPVSDNPAKNDIPPGVKQPTNGAAKPLQQEPVAELLGTVKIAMQTTQSGFRELVNDLSSAPYFLVIDSMLVLNSSQEPPRKDSLPETSPADGTNAVQRLPIIVGRETLNVSLRIRMLDFPTASSKAATK
jgi:hypothetical protein